MVTGKLSWLVLIYGIACFHPIFSAAQEEPAAEEANFEQPTTAALAKTAGFWKFSRETDEGESQLSYEWHRYASELDAVVHSYFRVDPQTKQVLDTDLRYFGVRGNQGQVHGVVVSSNGMVAELVGTVTDGGMLVHGQGALAGGGRIAADVRWHLGDEQHLTTKFTHMIGPGDYEQEYVQTLEKLDYDSPRDFFEGEGLVFDQMQDREVAAGLSLLAPFVGRWQVVDDQGETRLTVNAGYRAGKQWLFERWHFADGQGGLNISGVDPVSGRLALWTIAPGFIGRIGRWDVVSDRALGQVQATARLVRTFIGEDTFAAHWQDLREGTFVDRETGGYVARRAPRRQQPESQPPGPQAERAAADRGELPQIFATVGYMEVPEGGDELYRDVERVWKKIHQARKDAGIILDWVLLKVQRNSEDRGPYQYITFTMADSAEKLRQGNNNLPVNLSPAERDVIRKTAESRKMLGVDIWELKLSALPGRGPEDASPNFLIGFMKSKDEEKHFALERDVYRKVWREHANAGHIWNWSIWQRRGGQGLHADKPPFNMISVVSYHRDAESMRIRPEAVRQAARTAFPDDTPEQREQRLGQADQVRDMVGFEVWTVVDATGMEGPEVEVEATDSLSTNWRDEQWSMLSGTWRAPLPNGGYRIKRISPGKEILEVYNADGSLNRKSQADMSIGRVRGLNFFTVRNWALLDAEDAQPRTGSSYTSIYKIHDGKWYEQMRGIFAETDNIAPNQFLIYERVEE